MPAARSGLSLRLPCPIMWPKYRPSFSTNCNLFLETLNPFVPRKFNQSMALFLTMISSSPENKVSSTYWIIWIATGVWKDCNNSSKARSKRVGDSVHPWGNLVQCNCCFNPISRSSQLKAKIFLYSSASEHAQKSSFKSTMLYQQCCGGTLLRRVERFATMGYLVWTLLLTSLRSCTSL